MTSRLNTDSLISAIGVDLYDFDPLTGAETVHRFGTTEFVDMAGNAYEALIANTGITLGNQINDTLGGLQSLSWTAVASLVNTGLVTDLINYNTLINNRLDIRWFIWDALSGDIAEELTLYSGKVKSREFTNEIWAIRCEHIVTDLIQSFPTEIISPVNYPRTDPDNFGAPVPHVFGEMNTGPFDGEGRGARLAKCIDTAGVPLGGWLSSYVATVRGGLFEYNSGVWYEVGDTRNGEVQVDGTYDDSAGNITSIVNSSRKYRNYLGYATANSSLNGWEIVNDGRKGTSIGLEFNLESGEFFEAVFNQSSDRGIIQSMKLVIQRRGVAQFSPDWGVTLLKEGVSVLVAGVPDIVTDSNLYVHGLDITDFTWSDLALLTVKLPSFDVELTQIYLEIEFLRKEDDTLPIIFQRITGYNFTNPIWQIYRILIEPTLCNIDPQYIDLPSFQAAAEARDDWEFSFQINDIKSRDFVNSLNQECSSFLYIRDNKIACGVRTNTQEPVTAIIDTPDIRLEGQGIFCDFLPEDRIVNDVGLKFNQELASGKYFDILIASSLSRNDMPTAVTLQNNRWEASGLKAQVGDKAFNFITGQIHEITEANANYIVVDPIPDGEGRVLYGPNIAAKSVRSRYGNRVSRSMGGSTPNFSELGAYSNAYIANRSTAQLWIDAILDGLAEPPLVSKLATYWKYALLYIGDTILVDSPAFPEHLRPGKVGVTTNFVHRVEQHRSIDVDIRSPAEIGDYLIVDYEVMKITGRGNRSFRVERAALDSKLESHDTGVDIRLFTSKFQVKNKAQNLNGLAWSYTVEQSVPGYIPRPYLGSNRGIAPNEPTQQELNSNFYVGSKNGLIHEPRPGLMSSGMVPYIDPSEAEIIEETGGLDDTTFNPDYGF